MAKDLPTLPEGFTFDRPDPKLPEQFTFERPTKPDDPNAPVPGYENKGVAEKFLEDSIAKMQGRGYNPQMFPVLLDMIRGIRAGVEAFGGQPMASKYGFLQSPEYGNDPAADFRVAGPGALAQLAVGGPGARSVAAETGAGVRTAFDAARGLVQPGRQIAADAAAVGMQPLPRALAGSPSDIASAPGIAAVPFAGGPVKRAAERAIGDLQRAGTEIVSEPMGSRLELNRGGALIRDALDNVFQGADLQNLTQREKALYSLSKTGNDEKIIHTIHAWAGTSGRANIDMLDNLMTNLGSGSRDIIRQSLLTKMSDKAGQFNDAAFASGWDRLSNPAKDRLWGTIDQSEGRRQLESLARLSHETEAWDKLAGRQTALGTAIGMAGLVGLNNPLKALRGIVGAAAWGRILAKPEALSEVNTIGSSLLQMAKRPRDRPAVLAATVGSATNNLADILGIDREEFGSKLHEALTSKIKDAPGTIPDITIEGPGQIPRPQGTPTMPRTGSATLDSLRGGDPSAFQALAQRFSPETAMTVLQQLYNRGFLPKDKAKEIERNFTAPMGLLRM